MSGMMGLQIGIRALKAHQRALDVTGHNIANANTEGYSRQRAEMAATLPYTLPSMYSVKQAGQVGTGVEITQIVRLREEFIDERIRDVSSDLGRWTQRAKTMNDIQSIFAEPSKEGLRSALDNFWESLQELQNNPESGAVRAAVRETGGALTDVFNSMRSQLNDYQRALDVDIKGKVTEINNIAQRIADLNNTISKVVGKGENPNDLMDKRDLLIDQLSAIVNVNVQYDSRMQANITIGGFGLVMGDKYLGLKCEEDPMNNGLVKVVWENTNNRAQIKNGQLAGLIEARDSSMKDYMNELDTLARNLIGEFNYVHQTGFGLNNSTGLKFFEGTDAASIRLSDSILDISQGLNNIAAAFETDKPGDNRNAGKLCDIMKNGVMGGNQTSISEYWGGIIAKAGIDGQRAERLEDSNAAIKAQLEQQRASTSAVSLDEEMSNLIIYQHGYSAAARLIATQSEMLDTLIGIAK